ncbi:leucine-rich repeat-containing protein 24 isoform X1 [Stegostoma tigrinum]|uniref:leucine-rich repeat-containing protein 24 isoform X1 n=1 Tax=Stegostoma tigrinum TaxID=3053191 RepID=UPI00202B43EB|nr:leucine-rich repeat-containing protein 24 isoform X1 [Stegostoma tigrinum]
MIHADWMEFITTILILSLQVLSSQGCLEGCRCYSTTVECGSLGLTAVPPNIPAFTQTLFLQDNDITHISQRDFSHLSQLQNLYIQNNSLSTIDPGALSRQHLLVELALNGNRIQHLNDSIFEGLDHLRVLYLAGNYISWLASLTFRGLQRLQELHLQENNIQSMADQAFEGLSSLALLDLSSNRLHTLHQASIQPLKSLQELRLAGNQWRCDCVLHWLWAWTTGEGQRRLLLGKKMVCAEPPRLAGHSLLQVPGNSLVCIPPAVRLDHKQGLVSRVGDELRVSCQATGYPPPAVSWRKVSEAGPGPSGLLPGGATLTLRNLTAWHAGIYECEAHNPGGRASATFELRVNLSSGPGLGLRSWETPSPGLPPYQRAGAGSMEFTTLGPGTQASIAVGISLLTLVAFLLLGAMICRRRAGEKGQGGEEGGLYLNDYSDGPTTFAQLEEYRDEAGREMLVLDRNRTDFCTYKDTAAEPGRQLRGLGPLHQAQAQAQAQAQPQRGPGELFENLSGGAFKREIEYEIHC